MLRFCSAHEVPQLFQIVRAGHCKSQKVRMALCGAIMGDRAYLYRPFLLQQYHRRNMIHFASSGQQFWA